MKNVFKWLKAHKIIAALILFIILGGIYWYLRSMKSQASTPQYQTTQAEKGTLIVAITGSGKVSTANTTSLNTEIGGIVEEVYVKSGDYVKAGAPLAKINLDTSSQQKQSTAYASYLSAVNQARQSQISKASAQVALESARVAVLQAAQDVTAMENDLATDYINPATKERYTQNEIDVIRSKLTQARSNFSIAEEKYKATDTTIASTNASLASANLEYKNVTNIISAPISGVISNFTLQKGDTISLTDSTSSTTTNSNSSTTATSKKIATLSTGNKPSLTINLSEIDAPKVQVGNKVTITVDAFPNKTFTGQVTDIDTTGSVSSGVVTYPVTITCDIEINQLYANMTVTANIITLTKDNVLLVPTSAVQKQSDVSTVRVLKNGKVSTVDVEIGDASDTQVEITSGIAEGDQVVTGIVNSSNSTTQRTSTSVFGGSGFSGLGGSGRNVRIQTR